MADELGGFAPETDAEKALREAMGENDYLVDLWQLGEQTKLFAETTVGSFLLQDMRERFMESVRDLLDADDPGSESGRAAHAEARLNWRILSRLEEILTAGMQAEAIMTEQDRNQT